MRWSVDTDPFMVLHDKHSTWQLHQNSEDAIDKEAPSFVIIPMGGSAGTLAD